MNVLLSIRNTFSVSIETFSKTRPIEQPNRTPVSAEAPVNTEHDRLSGSEAPATTDVSAASRESEAPKTQIAVSPESASHPQPTSDSAPRRWSLQRLITPKQHTPAATAAEKHERRVRAATEAGKHAVPKLSASDRRAHHDAVVVRTLIAGPTGVSPTSVKIKGSIAKSELKKTKAALLQPREANKVIAHLRTLPPADAPPSSAPIHAVCLQFTDAEADEKHFRRMKQDTNAQTETEARTRDISASSLLPTVSSATLDSLAETFKDLKLVSLVTAPDFGLGQPGDGDGILAGALPTAETVINGVVQITPQLMSLGYATGRAIIPNHTGVYPPTDRMSVMTYWWGLELVLPEPTMTYLNQAQSISHSMMNFLSALALVYGGVREILPFVRYISQFMEWEFSAIKAQDQGKGVVCAATWIMPAAMVPRPWDFPPAPSSPTVPGPDVKVPDIAVPTEPGDVGNPSVDPTPVNGAPRDPKPSVPDDKASATMPPSSGSSGSSSAPPAATAPAIVSPIALLPGAMYAQAIEATSAA